MMDQHTCSIDLSCNQPVEHLTDTPMMKQKQHDEQNINGRSRYTCDAETEPAKRMNVYPGVSLRTNTILDQYTCSTYLPRTPTEELLTGTLAMWL